MVKRLQILIAFLMFSFLGGHAVAGNTPGNTPGIPNNANVVVNPWGKTDNKVYVAGAGSQGWGPGQAKPRLNGIGGYGQGDDHHCYGKYYSLSPYPSWYKPCRPASR
jgi:hypothetical protein